VLVDAYPCPTVPLTCTFATCASPNGLPRDAQFGVVRWNTRWNCRRVPPRATRTRRLWHPIERGGQGAARSGLSPQRQNAGSTLPGCTPLGISGPSNARPSRGYASRASPH